MKTEKTRNGKRRGTLWIRSGLMLIAAALFLVSYNLYGQWRAEQTVRKLLSELEESIPEETNEKTGKESGIKQGSPAEKDKDIEIPDYILNPDMEMPVKKINGLDCIGILRIPSLKLKLPVISQWSYSLLKSAPCCYCGSVYRNNLVIAAHNYASHFGNLKYLQEGDAVTFTDTDGNLFRYQVAEKEILKPSATEEMQSGDWDLTLFTCTIGGQSRVTIRCQRSEI